MTGEKTAREWRSEAGHLRDELATEKQRVAELQEMRGQSGVIDSDFINRSSLGHIRNKTWAAFAATVRGLPQSRIDMGLDEARTQSVANLLADLYTLGLTPPRSTDEAIRRKTVAQMTEAPSFFAVLSHPGAEYCDRCYAFWGACRPPRRLGSTMCQDDRGHKRGNRGYDFVRVRFLGEVAETFYRPGVWSLFLRAPEVVMMPGFGPRPGSSLESEDDG